MLKVKHFIGFSIIVLIYFIKEMTPEDGIYHNDAFVKTPIVNKNDHWLE